MKNLIKKFVNIHCPPPPHFSTFLIALALAMPAAANVAKITATGVEYSTVQAAITAASSGQTVQMIANSTIANMSDVVTVVSGKNVTLDLNGKSLNCSVASTAIVNVEAGATLTIDDSSAAKNGMIARIGTQNTRGVSNYGTLNLKAGIIANNYTTWGGSGLWNQSGAVFNMTGGVISNNVAEGSVKGAGVYMQGSSFTMTGGIICNNHVNRGSLGGGCGVYYDSGTFTVGGTAKIVNNTIVDGITAENIFIASGNTLTVSTATPFAAGAKIGATTASVPTTGNSQPVTSNGASSDLKYFFSDNPKYSSIYVDGRVKLSVYVCKIVRTGVMYETVQAAVNAGAADDIVQLVADSTENVSVASGRDVMLDLAGFALKGTGSDSVVTVSFGAYFAVTDSVPTAVHNFKVGTDGLWTLTEDAATADYENLTARPAANAVIAVKGGCITGGKCATDNGGGAIYLQGQFALWGGNLVGNSSACNGGAINTHTSGLVVMNGGRILGNRADNVGGGVFVYQAGSKLTMNGGTIAFNRGIKGSGGVAVWSGRFVMIGGDVSYNLADNTRRGGGVAVNTSGAAMTVGGNVKIVGNKYGDVDDNLYLIADKTLVVTNAPALAADAKIGVTTAVTPTAAAWVPVTGVNTANYAGNFRADAGYAVINDANVVKLAVVAAKLTPYDGTARPVTGESYTYRPGGTGSLTTVPYEGVLIVEGGVSNYYYTTVEMAIEAAKAGAVNTGYCSAANPNGCFKEGTPYDYANNDSLNPNLGKYTDTVTLYQNAGRLYNMGNSYSSTAPYGIGKGIVIDLNGYSITAIAAGRIPDGQVLVFRNGTISSGAMANDVLDDEPGTGYLPGAIAFADVNMTGTIWASTHAFFLLNGQYDIRLGNPANPSEDPSLLQLRGGSYKNDPRGYNIDYTDCHVELASKHPEIDPYFCRVVKGGSYYTVTFLNKASSSDETLGGQPFCNTPTNVVYVYGGGVAQTPAVSKPGAKFLGWTTSATGIVPEYTNDQLSTITSESEANVILYSVYGVEVGVPVFVALDECSTLPTDGREYTFVITNLDSYSMMPTNRFATVPVPPGRGETNCIGYGPDDLDNPWRMTYTKGDYYYHVSQVTNGIHAGEILDEGRWEIQIEVDPDATPRYKISSAVYYGKVADIDENSFHIVKADNNVAAAVTVEGSKTKVALGGNQVVSGDGFNTAVMKGKFAIDFTRNFRVVGSFTPPKASTPDGTCVGFMPNTQTLYPSDLIGGGNLGYIGNTKFAKSLVLDFDPYNNGSTYGDPGYNHFTLTETMDNGYPNYSTAQHKNVSSCWPTTPCQYSIVNDATANMLSFKVTLPSGTVLDYAYANPTNLFKAKTAYFFMSGVVRYGAAGSWGLGSAGSTAPSLTMYFDSFNYLGQRAGYGSTTNLFVNRQEAKVTYDAWGGAFADGEETYDIYAVDAKASLPPVPTRAGNYNFEGWYMSWTNGAAAVSDGHAVDPVADCTRCAKWTSPSVPREEGDKTLAFEPAETNAAGVAVGNAAALKGATNVLETTDLAIPEFTSNGKDGAPYVVIKESAFAYENYDKKRVREKRSGVTTEDRRLTAVTVSTFVTNIQSYAFSGCQALTNVTFTKTRNYETGAKTELFIHDWAFKGSSVKKVTFPADSRVVLDYGAFADAEYLEDIFILGDVTVAQHYPFMGAGRRLGVDETGNPKQVKLHLSAALAADPDYVFALTNGMSAARVVLSQEIEGKVEVASGPTVVGDTVSFTFTVESDSPWLAVNTDTVYLFWSTALAPETFIGNAPKHPTSLIKNGDGSWTATFEKPVQAGTSALFFQLRIGDAR